MNKLILISCFILGWTVYGNCQTATEAFRLSTSDPFGTARNLGTGNSMYAIGPDFSALGVNPAGIGGYWKSEFVGSLGLSIQSFDARLNADSTSSISSGNFNDFSIPNMGFVITTSSMNNNVATSNWAIGINRVADFDKDIQFEGYSLGSITDSWRENALNADPDHLNGFEEGLAYEAGAIYDFEEDNVYESDYQLSATQPVFKSENSKVRGGKSEIFLGYGANLNQKLLIGLSVNLPIVNSDLRRNYQEEDPNDGVPFFNNLEYTSDISTSGVGVNGKVGVIIKPTPLVNLSLAVHTPTKFHLTDNFNTTVQYDYTDENHTGPITAESPFGSFQYAMRTPWKLVGGLGIIAGKHGFISAGAQWADYSTMKYDYSVRGNGNEYDQDERAVNASIKENYGSALQLNFGGELAIQALRLRAGVELHQSAFNNDDSFNPSFNLGAGYRAENFYIDLGAGIASAEEGFLPYETQSAPQPLAVLSFDKINVAATVGLKF